MESINNENLSKEELITTMEDFLRLEKKRKGNKVDLPDEEFLEWYYLVRKIVEIKRGCSLEDYTFGKDDSSIIKLAFDRHSGAAARLRLVHRLSESEKLDSDRVNQYLEEREHEDQLSRIASKIDISKLPAQEVTEIDEHGRVKMDKKHPNYSYWVDDE